MIYTSYFANLIHVPNPISIAGKCPDFYRGPEYKILAPKYWFFQKYKEGSLGKTKEENEREYTTLFKEEVLKPLDPAMVLYDLMQFYPNESRFTLLCYEKPGEFCHRHIVASWLEAQGCDIMEIR